MMRPLLRKTKMKKNKNKLGVSLMISYVLLIFITISLSVGVYIWLKSSVNINEKIDCKEGTSLSIEEYNIKHKVKLQKTRRKYYYKNKEHLIKYIKQWKKENYERVKLHGRTRESRLRASIGSFNIREWLDLCNKYNNKCVCCNKKRKLTVDHVVPISKGGTSFISNIQPLCGKCNNRKRNKIKDYRNDKH